MKIIIIMSNILYQMYKIWLYQVLFLLQWSPLNTIHITFKYEFKYLSIFMTNYITTKSVPSISRTAAGLKQKKTSKYKQYIVAMNYNHIKYKKYVDEICLYKHPSGSMRGRENKPVEPCLKSLRSLFLLYLRWYSWKHNLVPKVHLIKCCCN